jgi:ubiquitin C-terminal hydrolase
VSVRGVCGIANVGSTCYLAAALQCLFQSWTFAEHFSG